MHSSAMESCRAAVQQRASWLRLRALLLRELNGAGASLATRRKALTTFDALPFRSSPLNTSWLPSEQDLACQRLGIQPALANVSGALQQVIHAAVEESSLLRAAVQSAGEDEARGLRTAVRLHHNSRDDIVSVVWQDSRGQEGSARARASFTVSRSRLDWLRQAHRAASKAQLAPTGGQAREPDEQLFRRELFCMLARYDGFSGSAGGAGSQAAVPPEAYAAFEAWAGARRGAEA